MNHSFIKGLRMEQTDENRKLPRQLSLKLALNLAINALFPPLLYALMRPYVATDGAGLALVGGVTAIWIVISWIWQRRLSWISLFTLLGLAVAVVLSQMLGGN